MRSGRWQVARVLAVVGVIVLGSFLSAQAQVFAPLDQYTDQFSAFSYSKLGKGIGILAMLSVAILAVTTRGHGMEIGIAALVVGIALFLMFAGPTMIFPMLGFTG